MRPPVVIIGAGPAGSVAATILASSKLFPVVLIEQHRFPRDKVCGECVSAFGIQTLRNQNLADPVQRLRPAILTRALIHSNNDFAEFVLPNAMWGISRAAMDQTLLESARDAGATILQPARCEGIEPGDRPRVRLRDLADNAIRTMDAKCVLVADGKIPNASRAGKSSGDFGLKAHFELRAGPTDAIELFGVAGHYGGIAPIEQGVSNLAFSVPADRIKTFSRDFDELLEQMKLENVALAARMRGARRIGDWLAAPLPRFAVQNCWAKNVIPLGNAAAAIEPIGGEGMGVAVRSAELAANAIVLATKCDRDVDITSLRAEYRRLWNTRRIACRAGGMLISSPLLARLAIAFAGRGDGRADWALRLVGK